MDDEPTARRPLGHQIILTIRRMFVSGVLVTVPVIITVVVLHFLFTKVDGILSPLVERVFGYSVPGMGLAATILIIVLVGILARNVAGSRLVALGELIITKTPLARTVYGAAKQLVDAVAQPGRANFNRAVLIEYPRKGMYAVGFASGKTELQTNGTTDELMAIFVPSTPTPITGFVVLVPRKDVVELGTTNEEAIRFLVSGGISVPPRLGRAVSKAAEV